MSSSLLLLFLLLSLTLFQIMNMKIKPCIRVFFFRRRASRLCAYVCALCVYVKSTDTFGRRTPHAKNKSTHCTFMISHIHHLKYTMPDVNVHIFFFWGIFPLRSPHHYYARLSIFCLHILPWWFVHYGLLIFKWWLMAGWHCHLCDIRSPIDNITILIAVTIYRRATRNVH